MRPTTIVLAALAVWTFLARAAAADTLSVNFCPGDSTCPDGVTEASLTFNEILNSDPNDYLLDLVISGNALAPAYVDEVSFKIDGAQTTDYEFLPTLLSAPGPGSPWVVFFDNVGSSSDSCTSNTGSGHFVCAQSGPSDSTNRGAPLPSQVLTWTFLVDLVDGHSGPGPLDTESEVNLRAQFLKYNGKNKGILSPDGGTLTRVPEPASLTLLGSGLGLLAAFGYRRKRAVPPANS